MAQNSTETDSDSRLSTSLATATSSAGQTSSKPDKPYKSDCQYCLSQTKNAGLHAVKQYKCDICFGQSTYGRHMRMHRKDEPFSCLLCSHECDSESNMRYHVSEVHAPKEWFYANKDKLLEEEKVDPSINMFSCQYCERTFKKKRFLFNHLRVHVPRSKIVNCSGPRGVSKTRGVNYEKSSRVHVGEPSVPNLELVTLVNGYYAPSSCSQMNLFPKVVLSSQLNDLFSRVAQN